MQKFLWTYLDKETKKIYLIDYMF